ncbi:MAG: hypothetical protein JWO66_2417 [Candidatus Eremiobacteraeota bacterium]|nr:hypothetical protein [Candidatus Eremiobacteraeota bacterium]
MLTALLFATSLLFGTPAPANTVGGSPTVLATPAPAPAPANTVGGSPTIIDPPPTP